MASTMTKRAEALDALGDRLAAGFMDQADAPSGLPALTSRDEAYAIQDRMLTHIGRAAGWKVGRAKTSPEPYCAPIPESRVIASGQTWPHGRDAPALRIEAEIAFILGHHIPAGAAPLSREDCLRHIRSIAPAIEVLGTRLDDVQAGDALWKLADLQATAGAVLGSELAWQGQPLSPLELAIDCPGLAAESGLRPHPFGEPVDLLLWLVNHVAARRGGLRAGDFVITGSYCGILEITHSGTCKFTFRGIGEVRVTRSAV